MKLVALCYLLIEFNHGNCQLTACHDDDSPVKSWLCGLNDWIESMKDWKQRIENACSNEDFTKEWEQLFECQDTVTVSCCNEAMKRCEMIDEFNCTICSCADGRYSDRKEYQQLWKKFQTDFQSALTLYDNKFRHCRKRSECDLVAGSTTDTTTERATSTIAISTMKTSREETTLISKQSATVSMTSQEILISDSTSAAMTSKVSTGVSSQTTIASSTAETATKGPCDIAFNGICYWTHVGDGWNVNFTRAEEICLNKSSTPAHFPNEEVVNNVVENLRSKMDSKYGSFGWSGALVWTGVIIDTTTGNVIHPSGDSYVKWYPGSPRTGSSYKTYTHVLLSVNSDPGSTNQGMLNGSPQWSRRGVVCQSFE